MKNTLAFLTCITLLVSACTSTQPNFLLILADDMGYSDIGAYGGEIHTPRIDQLATQGVRFTQFYNTARCCPTRASMMTGLYPHQAGMGHLTGRNMGDGYQGYLNDECVTIAELLRENGYFTALTGKWHAGNLREAWPENRGFSRFFGIHNYVDSYFKVLDYCEVFEDGEIVIPKEDFPTLYGDPEKEWYTTDVFTNKAIDYIDEALEAGMPFFQYVAYNAPHWPLEAHDEIIEKYLDDYQEGYEALRVSKYEKMKQIGLVSRQWKLPEQPTPDWNSLSDSAREDTRFRRAIYSAQIEILDENIGRLVDHLDEKGVLDETIILFLSDNGCCAEPHAQIFGYQWGHNTKWNYSQWRRNSARAGASQGEIWSVASNSPFRLHKRYTHEGGIATPLIVHWPGGIENSDRWDERPGHLIDIMATILDLTGLDYPETWNGRTIQASAGISFLPNLKNKPGNDHEALYWEHEGHGAIRQGDWKLVSLVARDDSSWELYNLKDDRTETNDLAQQMPQKVSELLNMWKVWALENRVLPWPDQRQAVSNPVDR